MLHVIKLIQESKYRWRVVSPKGYTLVDNLLIASQKDAVDWATSYVSSFNGWSFKIIPMEDSNGKAD